MGDLFIYIHYSQFLGKYVLWGGGEYNYHFIEFIHL